MDPSALIFIALAVAWAIYLIPKALEHHEESVRTRTVERFSATVRVLARREPVSRRKARLVPTRTRTTPAPEATATAARQSAPAAASSAAAVAAKRRLRVVSAILGVVALVAVLAALGRLPWVSVAAPVVLLAAWLIACRLMVKRERGAARSARTRAPKPAGSSPFARPAPAWTAAPAGDASTDDDADQAGQVDAVPAGSVRTETATSTETAESWDPMPVTLPTYVSKPVAPRSVSTIDLDATGVWSSGRSESDSELVRESQARDAQTRDAQRRAATERSARRHA